LIAADDPLIAADGPLIAADDRLIAADDPLIAADDLPCMHVRHRSASSPQVRVTS